MIWIDINCDDFNKHCLNIFLEKKAKENKTVFLLRNFNTKLLDYETQNSISESLADSL